MGLLAAGYAASLRLIEAGPFVRYQHYLPLDRLATEPAALAIVAAEAVLVAAGAWRERATLRSWIRAAGPLRLGVLAAALLLLAAAPSREPGRYVAELALAFGLRVVHLGAVVLAVAAVPPKRARRLREWASGRLGSHDGARPDAASRPRPDRVALAAALFATGLAAALALFVYERHPHVPDEVSYLYHARYLAEGRLSMPAPPVPEAFELDLMSYDADRWFSPVPPGWPALLAVGVRLGAPWLVNPVLAGLGVLLAFGIVRRLYDRPTARAAALLLAVSPWYLFLAMSFMTHTSSFAAAALAAWALLRWRAGDGAWWAGLSGASLGVVGLIRPLEAVGLGLILLIGLVAERRPRAIVPAGAALGLAAAAVTAVILPYNAHLTGSPAEFPIMAYMDATYGPASNALGFGPERGVGWGLDPFPGHGPRDVVANTALNATALDVELFGWPTGSLAGVLLFLAFGRWSGADRALVAAVAIVVAIHAFYWFSGGPDFGARYWFLAILPLVALSARGLQSGRTGEARARLALGAACLSVVAVACFVPWRAVDKYRDYRGMRDDVRRIVERETPGSSVVLVRGDRHPDFASAAIYNPLDLRAAAPVFAWDRGPDVRAALRAAYPDRPFYRLDGPTITGDGFRWGGPADPGAGEPRETGR